MISDDILSLYKYSDNSAVFDNAASEADIYNCFRLLLGRLPSEGEFREHCFKTGQPLKNVIVSFLNSPEFSGRSLLDPQEFRSEVRELSGFKMLFAPEDPVIGAAISESGDYETNVSGVFRELLQPGMRVLDIGANIGFYSLLSASKVGPSGRVWALEPNPRNISFLLANKRLNGFENLEVIQAAASSCWEVLRLFTDSTNGITTPISVHDRAGIRETVQALPASAVVPSQESLDIVKIDVEGFEGKAISGMYDLLASRRPAVFSEFTPAAMPVRSEMSGEDYLKIFYTLGYEITVLLGSGLVACGTSPEVVFEEFRKAGTNHIDFLATPA